MSRLIAALATTIVLCGCGSSTTAQQPSPSPSPSPSPTPLSCTASGAASSDWVTPDAAPGIVSAIASGDVLTLTFRTGTPAFDVQTQPNTHFNMDPSGQPIDLSGSAGVLLHLRGFRGDVINLAGDPSASSLGPVLLQVKKAGDFEGVVSIAAGLSSAGCASVSSSGAVLTIHFIQTPA